MKKISIILLCVIALSCATTDNQEEAEARIDALYAEFIINPESQPRLAIVPFISTNIAKSDTMGIQLHFEASIHDTEYFNLIEQSEAETILEAQAYSLNGCTDDECAIEIGKLLSAEQIIIGNVGTVGEIYYLNIKLIDVETGKILKAKNLHADSLEEMLFIIYPDFTYSGFKGFEEDFEEKKDVVNLIDFDDPAFGDEIEFRKIEIDGEGNDWEGIKPIKLSEYDKNTYYEQFYIAQDDKYVFFRIDVIDEKLLIEEMNHIFFNISPSMNEFHGQINLGGRIIDNYWRNDLHQDVGDPNRGESDWKYKRLPQEYGNVKDIIELKFKKEWLPNNNTLFISLGLHDDEINKDLYFCDRRQFNL